MHAPRPQPSGSSGNGADLRIVFVRRVHELLWLGYTRLIPGDYATVEEPAITGDLVQKIDDVLSERKEPWMAVFSVHDDPAVNDSKRKGKNRKRVDLRIDSGGYSPRARFRFESKRLGPGHSVKVYLGPKGLGCFLCGDYAQDEDHAGMLGYVQSADLGHWSAKIGAELNKSPAGYHVDPTQPFAIHGVKSGGLRQTYRSLHQRLTVGRNILIDHVLLVFH